MGSLIKVYLENGEVVLEANREGLLRISEIAAGLAVISDQEAKTPANHYHFAEYMGNAEPGSLALIILLNTDMNQESKRDILGFLSNNEELFEAIYYSLNGLDYINKNINGLPLHQSIKELPKGKFSPKVIIDCLEELTDNGCVERESIREDDFDGFCKYIFRITDKGKAFLTR